MTRKSDDAPLRPFADEATAFSVGGLNVENRLDRVSLHGSLDLTRDQAGLARARHLRAILDAVVGVLEAEDLPEQVEVARPERIRNPFA
ncbi:hypothetical protein ACE7GA_08110 [Roseomonas sp. CCTCC AB2023176]|uniref:hypothetical protein n=1 Tax=Roseomonas sp. CCTCC AB2023176 TaxID=3342640 RepID=UPI0035E24973